MRLAVAAAALALLVFPAAPVAASATAPEAKPPEGPGPETEPEPPDEPLVPPDWRSDLPGALREARATGRVVLLYFHADWCLPCEWVDRGLFGNAKMSAYVSTYFIPIRVDDTKKPSPESRRYDVRVYPSVLFLDGAGETLHAVLGPKTPRAFVRICDKVRRLPELIRRAEKEPDSAAAAFDLGAAFAELDQLERAAPHLRRVLQLDPDDALGRRAQVRLLLAMVPLEAGDADAALANLDAWMQKFPDADVLPLAVHFKGTILYRLGRLRDARAVFERLRADFPKHPKAYEADKAVEHIDALLRLKDRPEPGSEPEPTPAPKG
jgi:thiol-disulfide isomerase/thioredoxin